MYEALLKKTPLSDNEATLYNYLLVHGPHTGSGVGKGLNMTRGNVYFILENLEKLDLVERYKDGKTTLFRALSPNNLDKIVANEQRELETVRQELSVSLPMMLSDFQLSNSAPGVSFFEGEEGFKKVLYNTLSATTPILSYIDFEQYATKAPKTNESYLKQRMKQKIVKKHICMYKPKFKEEFIRQDKRKHTELRLVNPKDMPIPLNVQIYNNTVAFLDFSKETFVAIEVTSDVVAQFHRAQFEKDWAQLPTVQEYVDSL